MSYKFQKAVIETLAHFKGFSNATVIYPGKAICASSETKSVTGHSDVNVELPDTVNEEVGLPIWDIKAFHSIIELFEGTGGYNAEFQEDRVVFKSDDGKFTQEYFLSEPSLLEGIAPKPEKVEKYLSMEPLMSFDLEEDTLKTFEKGRKTSSCNTIGIRSIGGKIVLYSADVDDQGNEVKNSSVFRFNTNVDTNNDFTLGFSREAFHVLPGDYTVRIHNKFVVFKGKVISYVFSIANWSEV